MLLRDSPYKGNLTYAAVLELARRPAARPLRLPQGVCRLVQKAESSCPERAVR